MSDFVISAIFYVAAGTFIFGFALGDRIKNDPSSIGPSDAWFLSEGGHGRIITLLEADGSTSDLEITYLGEMNGRDVPN